MVSCLLDLDNSYATPIGLKHKIPSFAMSPVRVLPLICKRHNYLGLPRVAAKSSGNPGLIDATPSELSDIYAIRQFPILFSNSGIGHYLTSAIPQPK